MATADAGSAWAGPRGEGRTFLDETTRQGPVLLSHLKHCVTLGIIFLLNFFQLTSQPLAGRHGPRQRRQTSVAAALGI